MHQALLFLKEVCNNLRELLRYRLQRNYCRSTLYYGQSTNEQSLHQQNVYLYIINCMLILYIHDESLIHRCSLINYYVSPRRVDYIIFLDSITVSKNPSTSIRLDVLYSVLISIISIEQPFR